MVRYPELGRFRIVLIRWSAEGCMITVFTKCEIRAMRSTTTRTDMTVSRQLYTGIRDYAF